MENVGKKLEMLSVEYANTAEYIVSGNNIEDSSGWYIELKLNSGRDVLITPPYNLIDTLGLWKFARKKDAEIALASLSEKELATHETLTQFIKKNGWGELKKIMCENLQW